MQRDQWTEKYRPDSFDELVGNTDSIQRIQQYVEEENLPNMLFAGPPGVGKTASAVIIGKEMYGEDWQDNFLELNASDERGIDVIRERVKEFSRSGFTSAEIRLCFLDEADALTDDAQSALRRTMETYSDTVRFILSCNYPSKIISPIQSRCSVFKFKPVSDEEVYKRLVHIAKNEEIEIQKKALKFLAKASDGDVRRGIHLLQAASTFEYPVTHEDVKDFTGTLEYSDIEPAVEKALDEKTGEMVNKLQTLVQEQGFVPQEVLTCLADNLWDIGLSGRSSAKIMESVGESMYRIDQGADAMTQLEAAFCTMVIEASDDGGDSGGDDPFDPDNTFV